MGPPAAQRVLLISGSLPPMKCGVGDYTWMLARSLAKYAELNISIVTGREAADCVPYPGVTVLPIMDRWRIGETGRLLKALRDLRPDIVHIQYPTQGYGTGFLPQLLPLIVWSTGHKIVQTWHEYCGGRLRSALVLLSRGLVAAGLVVVRPAYGERVPRAWRWLWRWVRDRSQVRFIPNASAIPVVTLSEEHRQIIRKRYATAPGRLVAYFGFIYRPKRVHLLFEIADPERDCLVIVGEFRSDEAYRTQVEQLAESGAWKGRVMFAGFLDDLQVAELLAAADAVVLPFADGGGEWNTSISAAQAQGTFVLTTSAPGRKYDRVRHTYYAEPNDIADMSAALSAHIGERAPVNADMGEEAWRSIAKQHRTLYEDVAAVDVVPGSVGADK